MNLYYEGVDITGSVNITRCVHRDVSHGRADSLEIEMDHAAAWYRWGAKTDDTIRILHNGYDTGILYLNAVYPERDTFRILATSLPSAARRKAWGSFENKSLDTIVRHLAAECGLEARLYGIDAALHYPFLLRRNEGCAAFLDRLGKWEGTVIKAFNGAFRAISVEYAQTLAASRTLHITTDQKDVTYTKRENIKYSGITVSTPYAQATAYDAAAGGDNHPVLGNLPARDMACALRFARGLLLMHNREAEKLCISAAFDAGLTSMIRVDVEGNTDANGQWLVDEVEHDLYNGQSTAKLLRVLTI